MIPAIKRTARSLLILTLLTPGFAATALPFDDLLGVLDPLCDANVPPAVLERIGGASTQATLCSVRDVTARAAAVVGSAEAELETFMNRAFDDGFDLLRKYADLDTDLAALEEFADTLRAQLGDGVTLEDAFGYLAHSVAAQKLDALFSPSIAEEGSLAQVVEENRRLNPAVLSAEVESLEESVELQRKSAAAADTAQKSSRLAQSSLARGDEGRLTLNMTNPDPTNPGIADRAAERGKNAVSTRATAQVALEFLTEDARQRTSETVSVLTSLKELGTQYAYGVQEMANVAAELYAQRAEQQNTWRAKHLQAIESNYNRVQRMGQLFEDAGTVLDTAATQLAGSPAEGE